MQPYTHAHILMCMHTRVHARTHARAQHKNKQNATYMGTTATPLLCLSWESVDPLLSGGLYLQSALPLSLSYPISPSRRFTVASVMIFGVVCEISNVSPPVISPSTETQKKNDLSEKEKMHEESRQDLMMI